MEVTLSMLFEEIPILILDRLEDITVFAFTHYLVVELKKSLVSLCSLIEDEGVLLSIVIRYIIIATLREFERILKYEFQFEGRSTVPSTFI